MTTDNLPAVRQQGTMDLTRPITDLGQALELADALARSDLVPQALRGRPANIFYVLMTGQSLGLHWTDSLRVIYSAGPGQIGMRGSFLLSQVRKAGHTYTIKEADDACTFKLTRGDTKEEFSATFTIEDAIKGGLAKRNDQGEIEVLSRDGRPMPWMSWTKRMLRWRAVSDCVSFAAPEVALGFEIEGADVAEPQPEVVLTPAPPEPGGEAAPADQAAQAAQLAELNRQATPATPDVGGNPDMGGNAESAPEPAPGDTRGGLIHKLARQFAEIGWDPAKFRPDVLRACSMFAGRRIRSVNDLKNSELARLSVQLTALASKHSPEHQVVALADQVEAWREKFADADPHGYEQYEQGDVNA